MTDAVKRMGVAYGRLGLSTDAELIGRRADGVKAAAGELQSAGIGPLVQAAFDIGSGDARFAFLSAFESDPTFGVQPADREAVLLAGAVIENEMEGRTELSAKLALAVVTCACGGLRAPPVNDQLALVAQQHLAQSQGQGASTPIDRTFAKQPKGLTDAIEAVSTGATQYFNQAAPNVTAALKALGSYAESSAQAAARSDNVLLAYLRSLEQEMRVYWWVTGGWSEDAGKPFRELSLPIAALCAARELAEKHSSPVGLFAAPALIDLVLERGRSAPTEEVTLQDVAVSPNRDWRKRHFSQVASGPLAALLPVTAALGLSAESDDASDWQPRFERLTGISSSVALSGAALGTQLYRERLVARSLG